MKSKFLAITALTVLHVHYSSSIRNTSGNYSNGIFPNLLESDSDLQYSSPLQLFACEGSSIDTDVIFNISSHYFLGGLQDAAMVQFTKSDPDCSKDSIFTSTQLMNGNDTEPIEHLLYEHGWLLKLYNDSYHESIPPNRYCIDRLMEGEEVSVKYCRADCSTTPCISKCCFVDEICHLGENGRSCNCDSSGANKWTEIANTHSSEAGFSFVRQHYHCEESQYFTLHKNSPNLNASFNRDDFKILPNGKVQVLRELDQTWHTLPTGSYCIDGAVQSKPDGQAEFSGDHYDMVLHMCLTDLGPTEPENYDYVLYRILVPFAIVFLVLTILVYILTWSEQSVHGYTVLFYLVTLLALYIFITISRIPYLAHPIKHPTLCVFSAGAIHFFYLSSMCWLTSVSFDVWRTFKKMACAMSKRRGMRRFFFFFLFSFGYPALQVSVCAVIDAVYRDSPYKEAPVILPHYGKSECSMSNDGITYYLHIPISVLLACNIGFFIATVLTMIKCKKSIREAFRGASDNRKNKVNQSFGIYVRMFIIMGIFWVTQIVQWFVILRYIRTEDSSKTWDVISAVTDTLTVLQAVAIFYIFVCKQNVFTNLWHIQPWLQPLLALLISGGCCATPPPDTRKSSYPTVTSSVRRRGTLKSRTGSTENGNATRLSRDSNSLVVLPPKAFDETSRKTSVNSNVTVVSDMDMKASNAGACRSSCEEEQTLETAKTNETTM